MTTEPTKLTLAEQVATLEQDLTIERSDLAWTRSVLDDVKDQRDRHASRIAELEYAAARANEKAAASLAHAETHLAARVISERERTATARELAKVLGERDLLVEAFALDHDTQHPARTAAEMYRLVREQAQAMAKSLGPTASAMVRQIAVGTFAFVETEGRVVWADEWCQTASEHEESASVAAFLGSYATADCDAPDLGDDDPAPDHAALALALAECESKLRDALADRDAIDRVRDSERYELECLRLDRSGQDYFERHTDGKRWSEISPESRREWTIKATG